MDKNRTRGFTLFELLLSATLLVLLSAGVFVLVGELVRDGRRLEAQGKAPPWVEALFRTIECDLEGALRFERRADGAALLLHHGLDSRRLAPASRPRLVEYRIERLGDIPCLVRREEEIESLTSDHVHEEILALGVARFELRRAASEGESALERLRDLETPPEQGRGQSADLLSMKLRPDRMQCVLVPENPTEGPWQRDFLLR